ncbi:hypothetical protein [Agrobacterium rosae]
MAATNTSPSQQFLRKRRMLVLEPNLVENSGHHYTQIEALSRLCPEFEVLFVAGQDYNGFLGGCAGRADRRTAKLHRLRSKSKTERFPKRFLYKLRALSYKFLGESPATAYGEVLLRACKQQTLGSNDVIVVPSADIDALESVFWLSSILKSQCPKICLRFLTGDLGEADEAIRRKRLNDIGLCSDERAIILFTETHEMARYLSSNYEIAIEGGFYLPCNIDPSSYIKTNLSENDTQTSNCRVGVFGLPKKRKGSYRLANIISAVAAQLPAEFLSSIEFVIQGSSEDFSSSGAYGGLEAFTPAKGNVKVIRAGERLSPQEFRDLFASVDIILLPYDVSAYGIQGSGLIQDAVSAFKPIIHTKNMAMSDLLNWNNALSSTTDGEFAQSLIYMLKNLQTFDSGATEAARYYKQCLDQSPLRKILFPLSYSDVGDARSES